MHLSGLATITKPPTHFPMSLLPTPDIHARISLRVSTNLTMKRKGKTKVVPGSELMELSNVLVVPEMHCRLLSSEWAWRHDIPRTAPGPVAGLRPSVCLESSSGSSGIESACTALFLLRIAF